MTSERHARRGRRTRGDVGAVVVIVAAAMGALVVTAAVVLDLGGARRDRDGDQVAADAMALAGALSLSSGADTASPACQAAWQYIVVNLPSAKTAPAPSCNTFATACAAATARTVQATIGEYRITLTHPVPANHSLLQGQSATSIDGDPCDRIGVRIEQTRANLIARGSVALDVHAVARYMRGVGTAQAPLVLLDPHACGVLLVNGNAALTVNTQSGAPGYIDIDSDGAACANPNKVVLDVNGQGTVTAGQIAMWALADGDATSAYSSGVLNPLPIASSARVGSNGMVWKYNCDPANGCPGTGPAQIDAMVADWGGAGAPQPPGSFTRWTTSGRTCSPSGATVVPAGNWYIDCGSSGLSTNGSITFQGGNIVSDGPIQASGSVGLRVNCSDADPSDNVAPTSCATDPPAPSILYLRSGDLLDNNNLELRETTVYLTSGKVTISGNNTVTWTAPNDPTFRFDDLALWTTSTGLMSITGSVNTNIEGTIYAPNAKVKLAGNTGGQALGAQIFAATAELVGGSQLTLSPKEDRILKVGKGRPVLIR